MIHDKLGAESSCCCQVHQLHCTNYPDSFTGVGKNDEVFNTRSTQPCKAAALLWCQAPISLNNLCKLHGTVFSESLDIV